MAFMEAGERQPSPQPKKQESKIKKIIQDFLFCFALVQSISFLSCVAFIYYTQTGMKIEFKWRFL